MNPQVLAQMRKQQIVDIPQTDYVGLADYPVTSVLHTGLNRSSVLNSLKRDSERIRGLIEK
jgi:predicted ATP-grasp superfamily ATP-dependent carboligase